MEEKRSLPFGKRIRKLRLEMHLSQRALADTVGVNFTYLSKIENNKVDPPSDEVISKLAVALNADKEELLTLAAKVSRSEVREAVAGDNRIGVLFRRLQGGRLSDRQIKDMLEIAQGKDTEDAGNH